MIHVQHGETGWDSVCTHAFIANERTCMRDDDWQPTFEGLLAVVVVLGSWVECCDATADVRHFGTVNELVPDFGSERKRLSARYRLLITYT